MAKRRWVDSKYRRRMVAKWIEEHGRMCVGWECPPHLVSEYTPVHWDHIIPRSKGGDEYGPGQLMCKHCNEAKHNSDPRDFVSLKTSAPSSNPLSTLEW